MSFVSYAQNYEDVALFRALGKVANGCYVDVGAGDPIVDSVTRAFYERGWRGVNIEPVMAEHARLVADRPEDVNLNVAIADTQAQLTLHEVIGTGMSTLVPEVAELHRAGGHQVRDIAVTVTTLDAVWTDHDLQVVHFLKVDVEGAERRVLAGLDLARRRPWVILVESTLPNSMTPAHEAWEPLLVDRGYVFVYFDGLNRFYVAREREEALRQPLALPPNYFDRIVRHGDAMVQQRAHSLGVEVEALRGQLRGIAASLGARTDENPVVPAGELATVMEWLTAQIDEREARTAAERAQAAHYLHLREVAHAERVGEMDRMIEGLRTRSDAFQAEIENLRRHHDAEVNAERAQREAERAQHEAERAQREAERAQTAHARQVRETEHAERVDELSRTIAALGAQADALRAETLSLHSQREAERAAAQMQESLIADLEIRIEALRVEAEHLGSREQQLRQELGAAAKAAEMQGADFAVARAALAEERGAGLRYREQAMLAENEIRAMQASLSFRVTASLRWFRKTALHGMNPVVLLALRAVRATPGGVALAGKAISPFPSVHRRLRRFADLNPRAARVARRKSPSAELPLPPAGASVSTLQVTTPSPAPGSRVFRRGERIVYFYVDHTAHCPVNTGMQRVARALARGMLESGEIVRFVKWDAGQRQLVLVDQAELRHLSEWGGPTVAEIDRLRYPTPAEVGATLPVHDLSEGHWLVVPEVTHINFHQHPVTLDVVMSAKLCGIRSAFIYYDAIPLRRAEMAAIAPAHEVYMQQLLLADLIVPISEWSGCDLASFFVHHQSAKLSPSPRVAALRLPGESHLSPRSPAAGEPRRRLILSVGTIEHRKNQHRLLAAFERFVQRHPREDWQLTLVGNVHPTIADEIGKFQRRTSSIAIASNLSDEALSELYRNCAFTVFPSVEEGFGLPILESLWHGKPCICANFGAMLEVARGGGCLVVDTHSHEALGRAIEVLALDSQTRERLAREARERRLASWADYTHAFARLMDGEADPLRRLGTLYYCIEHTVAFAHNTGIQRVVRGLARSLLDSDLRVVPCKWSNATGALEVASDAELDHFAQWNGPPVSAWTRTASPGTFYANDWLLVPELTVYPGGPDLAAVKAFSERSGLRVAAVFYDALPWKMREMYSAHWGEQHARYMEALGKFERVLAISEHSRRDLLSFLRALKSRTPDLERRVVACSLPGEFLESPRSSAIRRYAGGPVKLLSVGSIEPRKNHLRLLRAFRAAQARTDVPLELTLAGGFHMPEPEGAQFRRLVAETSGVTWEQKPDDARLRVLYAEADFTVYSSLEEGFGLPILESLWHARPCICRDRSAMAEVAQGGGCVMVDTADEQALAEAIRRVAEDHGFRLELAEQAVARPFRTWLEYGRDFATTLASERSVERNQELSVQDHDAFYRAMANLAMKPRLSICITTYNRAGWLAVSLRNLMRLWRNPHPDVEIVVCDNASTDGTPEVVQPYLCRADFRYHRNPANVGMLGNLRATAHHSRGRHVWILGDDDLVKPGAIERVLSIVTEKPGLALVYLNYAYTREDDARKVTDLDRFLADGIAVVAPGPVVYGPIHEIATKSENFFTAIYCLVFRRDHALRAYSQNTEGRPFSTMLTSIPTSYHVLSQMMDEPGCWVGEPQLVVNMNVSWMKYASLWVLERLPELFDTAEVVGADPEEVDHWRAHNVPGVGHFFKEILENDVAGNAEYFSPTRLVARFKHVEAFAREVPRLKAIYEAAHARGHAAARVTTDEVFAAFRSGRN